MSPEPRQRIQIAADDQVFILTGAGISAESGLPTFRDPGGLWRGRRPEEVATPAAWRADPELVWQFYSERRSRAAGAKPNPAHVALAQLEREIGDRFFLCTQNVDSLHEQAGSRRVLHIHGQLFQSRCERCERPPFDDKNTYMKLDEIPRCDCGGRIRPHVCWFGEMPFEMERVLDELGRCTIFLCVGSSGLVHPAASFPLWAGQRTKQGKARSFYVGMETPANRVLFQDCYLGKAGEILPGLMVI